MKCKQLEIFLAGGEEPLTFDAPQGQYVDVFTGKSGQLVVRLVQIPSDAEVIEGVEVKPIILGTSVYNRAVWNWYHTDDQT